MASDWANNQSTVLLALSKPSMSWRWKNLVAISRESCKRGTLGHGAVNILLWRLLVLDPLLLRREDIFFFFMGKEFPIKEMSWESNLAASGEEGVLAVGGGGGGGDDDERSSHQESPGDDNF